MTAPSQIHDLLAATIHQATIQKYHELGIPIANYVSELHYSAWAEAVEALLIAFPNLSKPDIPELDKIIYVHSAVPPNRHTHSQLALITPDGCIDRLTIRPSPEDVWAASAPNGKYDPAREASMRSVGYKLLQVLITADP